jgi:hypothetical protein
MFFLKACAKCQGDLVMEGGGDDRWGEPADIVCIQCGYTARPPERELLARKMRQAMQRRGLPVTARERRPVGAH